VQQLVDAAAALSAHVERLERENAEYRTITDALDRLKRN
jgi:prefoldin subunit 5